MYDSSVIAQSPVYYCAGTLDENHMQRNCCSYTCTQAHTEMHAFIRLYYCCYSPTRPAALLAWHMWWQVGTTQVHVVKCMSCAADKNYDALRLDVKQRP